MSDDPIMTALATLVAGQERLQDGQTRLEVGQANLRSYVMERIDRLDARQEVFATTLRVMRAEFLDELGKTRSGVMERIDRLQDIVTAIRDDIAVNYGATEAAQRANDNTRELVRLQAEQVSIMWKQLKQAQQDIRELKGDP